MHKIVLVIAVAFSCFSLSAMEGEGKKRRRKRRREESELRVEIAQQPVHVARFVPEAETRDVILDDGSIGMGVVMTRSQFEALLSAVPGGYSRPTLQVADISADQAHATYVVFSTMYACLHNSFLQARAELAQVTAHNTALIEQVAQSQLRGDTYKAKLREALHENRLLKEGTPQSTTHHTQLPDELQSPYVQNVSQGLAIATQTTVGPRFTEEELLGCLTTGEEQKNS